MEPFETNQETEKREEKLPGPEDAKSPDSMDPSSPPKPEPGESYSEYLHRLEQLRKSSEEESDYASQEYWNGLGDFGRGKSGDPNYGPIPEEYRMNGMSKAAFVCGILSIITIYFGFSLFFGALGVLFALLSRRERMGRQAKIALVMSGAGILAFVVSFAVTLSMLISSGIMGRMMERVRTMDLSDPEAVTILEQELLDEILGSYGVQSSGTRT